MSDYWGHSKNGDDRLPGIPEPLRTHIERVADRAATFAKDFGAEAQGRAMGLFHDLGKYADQFQRRVRGGDPKGRDHASVGAILAARCYKSHGILAALAIEGHHTGLTQLKAWDDYVSDIAMRMEDPDNGERFTSTDVRLLIERFKHDGFEFARVGDEWKPSGEYSCSDMLDARMLFSTLVDADFLETEAHFAGDAQTPYRPRVDGPTLGAIRALAAVQTRIEGLRAKKVASDAIHDTRQALVSACLDAAEKYPPGLFTLSAPTGSGKTLAMLTFALRHAVEHRLRRIVLVIPFLNIMDQTAKEYQSVFSIDAGFRANFVIEDHSNVRRPDKDGDGRCTSGPADAEDEGTRFTRLLAENWDAPIVLTTSVQCLESLMSNRPAACRKLHRLARSVILFDEVQTLPPNLIAPTLATLSRLSERFNASVVFATATQPAFDHLHQAIVDAKLASTGWRTQEIVPDEMRKLLFAPAAERISVRWQHTAPIAWDELADQLAVESQVLCIVNLKRHARLLAGLLGNRQVAGVLHLSTNMCPAHRNLVLGAVRAGLDAKDPVRLVATQCVEAGVDVDFPAVYRAFGPLEAIAQAAGRCNRHGLRSNRGEMHVFQPMVDGKYMLPSGAYTQAACATETFLNSLSDSPAGLDSLEILNSPDLLHAYYRQFYALTGAATMPGELKRALDECNFADVARLYRLISSDTINILVPYDEQMYRVLRAEAEDGFGSIEDIRHWIARARPHAVSPYRPRDVDPIWCCLMPVQFSRRHPADNDKAEWFVALDGLKYDKSLVGLIEPESDVFIA